MESKRGKGREREREIRNEEEMDVEGAVTGSLSNDRRTSLLACTYLLLCPVYEVCRIMLILTTVFAAAERCSFLISLNEVIKAEFLESIPLITMQLALCLLIPMELH